MTLVSNPEEENFTVIQNMEILRPLDTEVVMGVGWCMTQPLLLASAHHPFLKCHPGAS